MITATVDRNSIKIDHEELITSGSVKTNFVKFDFSPDWNGLTKTAIFQTRKVSIPVVVDKNNTVAIPWEAMAFPKEEIKFGVYGVRFDDTSTSADEEIVLPTIWGSLGKVVEGVLVQSPPITDPTKDAYLQLLDFIKNLVPDIQDLNERVSNGTIFAHSMTDTPTILTDYLVPIDSFVGIKPVVGHSYIGIVMSNSGNIYFVDLDVSNIDDSDNVTIRFSQVKDLTVDERLAEDSWFYIQLTEEPVVGTEEYQFQMEDFIGQKPKSPSAVHGVLSYNDRRWISEILVSEINKDGITCTGSISSAIELTKPGGIPYLDLLVAPHETYSAHDYETLLNKSLKYSTWSGDPLKIFGELEVGKEFSAYFLYDGEQLNPTLRYYGVFVCDEYGSDLRSEIKATLKDATFVGNRTESLNSFLTFFKLDELPAINTEINIPFKSVIGLMPQWLNTDHRGFMTVGNELYLIDFRLEWIIHDTEEFQITFNGIYPISKPGPNGVTFVPSVSKEGIISFINDGGLVNPDPVNIKGPIGPVGDDALVYSEFLTWDNVTGDPAPVDVYSFVDDGSRFNRLPKLNETWIGVMIYYSDADSSHVKDVFVATFKITDASEEHYYSLLIDKKSVMPVITIVGGVVENDGLPAGGTTSQILAKKSNANYDTHWVDAPDISVDSTLAKSPTNELSVTTPVKTFVTRNEYDALSEETRNKGLYGIVDVVKSEQTKWFSPMMTSDTEPQPYVASASSTVWNNLPYKAFSNNIESMIHFWHSSNTANSWIQLDFGSPTMVKGVKMLPSIDHSNTWNNLLPKSFTVSGSNDGSIFIDAYTFTPSSDDTYNPQTDTYRIVHFQNEYSYRYWRITSHSNYGGNNYAIIQNIQFLVPDADNDSLVLIGLSIDGNFTKVLPDDVANGTYFIGRWTEIPVVNQEYTIGLASFIGKKPVANNQYMGSIYHDSGKLYDVTAQVLSVESSNALIKILQANPLSGSSSGSESIVPGDGLSITDGVINIDAPVRSILTQSEYDSISEDFQTKGFYIVEDDDGSDNIDVISVKEIYSTEEVKIGVWIDGKPLYRKVLQGTSTGTGWISLGSLNLECHVVMLRGYLNDASNNLLQIPYQDELGLAVNAGDSNVIAFCNFKQAPAYADCPITAIVEYTKTTD